MPGFHHKIIHIDMDCFYAAIEMRDNPVLQGKPVAVGGEADRRGVLCTCNYEARKYGVRSAMSSAYAMRLCPDLILLPVNMSKYRSVAMEIRAILSRYSDILEPLSLDEAYLDVSACEHYQGSATWIAQAIRHEIFQQQQLTASAGIAPNKFLAKVASDWNKPNGQFVIRPEEVSHFIAKLPITKIPGVGKVTAKKIHQLGISNCQELQALSLAELNQTFGTFGQKLYDYCRGRDEREVEPDRIRKSVSVEETFAADLPHMDACLTELPLLHQQLEQRLKNYSGRIIKNQFIKIKFNNFNCTTAECVSSTISLELFKQLCRTAYQRQQLPVRLIGLGVRFQEEEDSPGQLALNV